APRKLQFLKLQTRACCRINVLMFGASLDACSRSRSELELGIWCFLTHPDSLALPTDGSLNLKPLSILRAEDSCRYFRRFQFHRCIRITNRQAFDQILAKKWKNAAETLVLRRMNQLVCDQGPLTPAIPANENSILQRQPARFWTEE